VTTTPTLTFAGIGSGTDWSNIISALVAAEKAPATAINQKKSDANTQLSLVGTFVSQLNALSSAATGFATAAGLWSVNASSSNSSIVNATASGTGTPGSYTLVVNKLAQGETREGKALTSGGAGAAGSGTIMIGVGTGAQTEVDYSATDSLADIAARINSTVSGVSASAIYDGTSYHLVLNSQATGKANGLNITETGSGLGLADPASVIQPADDASVKVNGVVATSGSNHITNVIPGVTLDLQATTPAGAPATLISVAQDPSSATGKIQGLVNAYNSVARLVSSQLTYNGTVKGQDTLFGDPIVTGLQMQLGGLLSQVFTHGTGQVTARDLGITLNADGTLALDTTKLAGKLASDPSAATDLLTGANGLAAAMGNVANQYTSATGPLVSRQQSLQDAMKNYDTQVQEINDRGSQLQTRLQKQFAALDTLMAQYNSSSTFLSQLPKVGG